MRRRTRFRWVGVALVALLIGGGALAPAAAEEKWGPFRGRVVDAETGQPIQGAVVLMTWLKLVYAVIQTNTEFYDAREAVSGPDGTFEIPRLTPPFFRFNIITYGPKIFAPGYAEHRWVVTPPTGEALVDPTVVEMQRLKTRDELLQKSHFYPPSQVPEDRMPEYIRAINIERKMLGLKPIGRTEGSGK
jgi:hypothetical protein